MKILNNRVAPMEEIHLPNRDDPQPNAEPEPQIQNDTASEKKPDKTNPEDRIGLLSHLFYW
ncbi:hypothetical protein C0J52_04613 [Blattella germanica]|nr:hypothetical protein C0J52_04613 [Blattella germanica]